MSASAFFRETLLGQIIRSASNNKLLQYPEERPDFVIPDKFLGKASTLHDSPVNTREGSDGADLQGSTAAQSLHEEKDIEKTALQQKEDDSPSKLKGAAELALIASKSGDYIIVDWYSETDPSNPQNWPSLAKNTVMLVLYIATFAIYAGSSIIILGYGSMISEFRISEQQATLTLSMYILAYGVGAMLWSPLSEIPALGRNKFYWAPIFVFVCLQVAAPLTHNYSGLVAIRFFTGFLGSPVLATAGASLQDVYNPMYLPIVFSLWALSAFMGPSLGPLVGGFAVEAHGWRWTMWELLWLVGFAETFLVTLLPETSHPTILLRRARRLRKLTGNEKIRSMGELEQAKLSVSEVMVNAFIRPTQIILLDPQIMFADLYIALLYCAYYLFFAALPNWQGKLGWSVGTQGLSYISILIGGMVGCILYVTYQVTYMVHYYKTKGWPEPEKRLETAVVASVLLPIGLFIFAWTAKPGITWVAALIGVALVAMASFIIFQCILFYIALAYPKYSASILAGNDFIRSSLAAGIVHAGIPLYNNLTVAGGTSLVAGLTIVFILPLFLIFRYGKNLRDRSRFTE